MAAKFSVHPDALRSLASMADDCAHAVRAAESLSRPSDVGNAGLSSEIGTFSGHLDDAWTSRVSLVDEVGSRLRRTARLYESADAEAAARMDALRKRAF